MMSQEFYTKKKPVTKPALLFRKVTNLLFLQLILTGNQLIMVHP